MTTAVLQFPRSDSALLAWSLNVLDKITADPSEYNLVAADATAYGLVHTAYADALALCDPTNRNKANVAAKNTARTNLKNAASLLANKVYSGANVTVAQKVSLGMPPRNAPSPIPAPTVSPTIEVLSTSAWTVKIRLINPSTGSARSKGPGISGISIFSFVGANPPADISQYQFEGNSGKTVVDLQFPTSLAAGTKVWITAFYFNGRKQSGPISAATPASLPGGGVGGGTMAEAA